MLKKILSLSAVCILFSLQASANIRNYIPSYQMAEGSNILGNAIKSIKDLLPSSNKKQNPVQNIPSSHQVINPENSTEEAQKDTKPISTSTTGHETQNETITPSTSPSASMPTVDHSATPKLVPQADDSTKHLQPTAIETTPSLHPEQTNVQPAPGHNEDADTQQNSHTATEEPSMLIDVTPLAPTQNSISVEKTKKSSTETSPPAETSQEIK